MQLKRMFRQLAPKSKKQEESQVTSVKPKKTGAKIILTLLVVGFAGELFYLNFIDQPQVPPPISTPSSPIVKKPAIQENETFNIAQTFPFWIEEVNNAPDSGYPAPQASLSDPLPSSFPTNVPKPDIPPLPSSMPLPSGMGGLMPAIPHNSQNNEPLSGTKVTGLILGNNSSDSVAILSDGSVLKEGQKYNGNTVSSVSEHGVTFEDGTRMNYK